MKLILSLVILLSSFSTIAQDHKTYFGLYDRKVYSLKTKGVKDFVVDVKSSDLTQKVNDQKIFGNVKDLIFRVHWTLVPERLAVDIVGLPEGFFEAKNQLRASFLPLLDNLLPMPIEQRFPGYKILAGTTPKNFVATDSSGLAPIPKYLLKFDELDRLIDITGQKPVGSWSMNWAYDKKAFSEGKWVIGQVTVTNTEGGQTIKTSRKLNYGSVQGIGVLTEVVLTVEQIAEKTTRAEETIEFTNYKINTGEGMRYFLGDSPAPTAKPVP